MAPSGHIPKRLLLVSTQTWHQHTRMVLRLVRYGCQVSALCPSTHELRYYEGLQHFFTLDPAAYPLESLAWAILRSGADYLVPGDDKAVWMLHELASQSPIYRPLVERSLGPERSFATVRSRARLLAVAKGLGIAVPETALAQTPEGARSWSEGRTLPFVLKRDGTFGGEGVEVIHDRAAVEPFYTRSPHRNQPAEVCVQSFVEGFAANAMFACSQGRVVGAVQARVLASKGKTGPSVVIRLFHDARIERAGTLLAESLQLSGFFGLDFILEAETGTPLLIELNPRCTQLGHIALPGQADLIAQLWRAWGGREPWSVGEANLPDTICFHPGAQQWATDSRLLASGRPDVCAEDMAIVDRLAQGSPAILPRASRSARRALIQLRNAVRDPQPPPIHYFAVEL